MMRPDRVRGPQALLAIVGCGVATLVIVAAAVYLFRPSATGLTAIIVVACALSAAVGVRIARSSGRG